MRTKTSTIMLGMLLSITLYAQNYQITFNATGQSTTVDAVHVENLTQCTNIDINGSDILHLVATLGFGEEDDTRDAMLRIYPNPAAHVFHLDFTVPVAGPATLYVSDMRGRIVLQETLSLSAGPQSLSLTGTGEGIFNARIVSESYTLNGILVSLSDNGNKAQVSRTGKGQGYSESVVLNKKDSESTTSVVQMQYNAGDVLKLTGTSGIYKTVYMLVPVADQTVEFTFLTCTDADGQHYPVVKIGDQWWMAENLNVGTYVPIASPQVAGTKFCMNINGVADPSCPMGGLYEWNILMDGATPCNGTGAPPNDRCAVPAKGLCPDGWHLPSHYEWTTLTRHAGSSPASFPYDMSVGVLGTDEGGNLKTNCTGMWWTPNAGATNITGFSGIPGGDTWAGVFEDFGQSAYFWTSTWSYGYMPWVYALNYSITQVGRSLYVPENGFSCRCVRD